MAVTIDAGGGFDGQDVELTVDGRSHVLKAARTSPLTGMADELVVDGRARCGSARGWPDRTPHPPRTSCRRARRWCSTARAIGSTARPHRPGRLRLTPARVLPAHSARARRPAARRPAARRPAAARPAAARPASTPARGSPARGSPARGSPARGSPARGTPARGTPARGTPARGTRRRGHPGPAAQPLATAAASALTSAAALGFAPRRASAVASEPSSLRASAGVPAATCSSARCSTSDR